MKREKQDRYVSPDPAKARYRKNVPNFSKMIEKHGAEWFNTFRRLNPDCEISFGSKGIEEEDLRGINLSGLDLSGMHLGHRDLSGAILTDCICHGTNFGSSNLGGARMDRADLTSARLRGTFQHLTSMQGTILRHTKLAEVNLCEAICQADLTEADLRGAGRLYEILKPGAQLQGVDLSGETIEADLTGANLSKARLIETDLRGATLVRVNLDNANIAGAQFTPRGLRQFDISRSLVTTKREDGTYIEGVVTDYLYR